jgi:sugar/nucleoside kinase (ribokinase family)
MSRLFPPATNRHLDLLSFGNPNIDLVFGVERVPLADQKCLGRHLGTFAGGTTANVACAAGQLGARTSVYGQIGDDPEGQVLKAEFERFKVATGHLQVARGTRSSTALIMINAQGEKALIYVPMPDVITDLPPLAQLLAQTRVLYTMPYDIVAFGKVAQVAHQRGADVVIDIEAAMVPDPDRLDALLALSDVVFFSESSFHQILRSAPTANHIQQLLRKGPRAIIVTLGPRGALAVTSDEVVRQVGFPANVIDSTGAGDCFIGALLAAALEGQSLEQGMRLACAAAAISLGAIGARTRLPDRETVASFLQSRP